MVVVVVAAAVAVAAAVVVVAAAVVVVVVLLFCKMYELCGPGLAVALHWLHFSSTAETPDAH